MELKQLNESIKLMETALSESRQNTVNAVDGLERFCETVSKVEKDLESVMKLTQAFNEQQTNINNTVSPSSKNT